jgi:hypothetical protein
MVPCNHTTLELLPEPKKRLRCRSCHLTIGVEELGEGYCPECFEVSGNKQYEFEELGPLSGAVVMYRCEQCGVIIPTAGATRTVKREQKDPEG